MIRRETTHNKQQNSKGSVRFTLLLLALYAMFSPYKLFAQDMHFSQFYESPLTLNPALCGSFDGDILAEANYRNQWASALGSGYAYSTMAADLEYKNILKSWTGGFLSPAISFYSDKAGDIQLSTTSVNATIAGGIFLNSNSTLTAGLQGGWAQNSINLGNVAWDEQYINGHYDPNAATGEPVAGNSHSYADFSGGLSYSYTSASNDFTSNQYTKYNGGIAFYHVNEPDISFYNNSGPGTKLYIRYVIHADAEFKTLSSPLSLAPAIVFYRQGPAQEFDMGVKLRYKLGEQSRYTDFQKTSFADFGVYYRWGDSFIALLEIEFTNYAIGFSYDINTSEYLSATSGEGAFELSLKYTVPHKKTLPDLNPTK